MIAHVPVPRSKEKICTIHETLKRDQLLMLNINRKKDTQKERKTRTQKKQLKKAKNNNRKTGILFV